MSEGIKSWDENIGAELSAESFSGAIIEHFREVAERDFSSDITPLRNAFLAEKGINPSDVSVEE